MEFEQKKDEPRIVFMGTPDFAVAGLDALLKAKYQVVGVVTAPDRPAGRGRKLNESAVKRYAKEQNLTVLQPTNLKDEAFLEQLGNLNGNLFVVVAFRMLPKIVWQMPKYGTFNLHASLLPQYRGAAPINWAIINGETQTGVTTFFIDEKIDTGNILLQDETTIGAEETAGELHDKLMVLGAQLIVKTVGAIFKGTIKPVVQSETLTLNAAPKIHKETCEINWQDDMDRIYNHIRGLSPYPVAWTTLVNNGGEIPLKIYLTSKEIADHQLPYGHIVAEKRQMKVAVRNGYIVLEKIQLPGKKAMSVQEVLNGFPLEKEAQVR